MIIVTHNSAGFITNCLQDVIAQSTPCDVVVIDNGSIDGTADLVLNRFPGVDVFTQENRGFGAGCNRGVRESAGDVIAFLNPDTRPERGWLARLVEGLEAGRIHTSQIIDEDRPNRVQTLGLDLHYTGIATLRRHGERAPIEGEPEEVPGLSGAAFAMMRSDFEALGGFDEGFFLYMEDVDLAWRARRAGMKIWGIPASRVLHRRAGRLNPQKLQKIRAGRQRLLHKHVGPRARLLLAPALISVRLLESIAALQIGRSPLGNMTSIGEAKFLQHRPRWLRLAIPLSVTVGTVPRALLAVFVNPLLVLNGLLWLRGPR